MAGEYRIVPGDPELAPFLAAELRQADRDEIEANMGPGSVDLACRVSFERSAWSFAAVEDRGIICAFGVAPWTALGSRGVPWCLMTDLVMDHRRAFIRDGRVWLDLMRRDFVDLVNLVDERNLAAIRWLKWLGFRLGDTVEVGPDQMPFRVFSMDTSRV